MNPVISSSWKEFSIKYKCGKSVYNIRVLNRSGKNYGVEKVILNSVEVSDKKIKLNYDGGIIEVEIIMWHISDTWGLGNFVSLWEMIFGD